MLILIVALASVLAAVWLLLLALVGREDWITAATNQVLDNRQEIEKLRRQDAVNARKLEQYQGISARVMGLFLNQDSQKKIRRLEHKNEALQSGDVRSVSLLVMPGYVLQRLWKEFPQSEIYRGVMGKSVELYGRKYAADRTRQLFAQLLSYPLLGLFLTLALGAVLIGTDNLLPGLGIIFVGSMLVLVLTYALYDELGDRLHKRRAAISRQFPNVVSKLALLVTSGMIMDSAWRETAYSQELELYQEMRKTSEELSNLVEPAAAYSNFIDRCNTKETTKLASAIIQSQSKGNAEIGALLKGMAHDAWQERRHTAKRDSEAANSKLMIPTMMLFVAILVMIMVPVAANFTSLV